MWWQEVGIVLGAILLLGGGYYLYQLYQQKQLLDKVGSGDTMYTFMDKKTYVYEEPDTSIFGGFADLDEFYPITVLGTSDDDKFYKVIATDSDGNVREGYILKSRLISYNEMEHLQRLIKSLDEYDSSGLSSLAGVRLGFLTAIRSYSTKLSEIYCFLHDIQDDTFYFGFALDEGDYIVFSSKLRGESTTIEVERVESIPDRCYPSGLMLGGDGKVHVDWGYPSVGALDWMLAADSAAVEYSDYTTP